MFKKLPFYNVLIEKPLVKRLKNIDLLHELPFYNELSIKQISKALKRYARNYRIEKIELKDPLVQLESRKPSIKDLFKDLLDENEGFKYQITVKVLLSKHKVNGDMEFPPVYFNSTTKTVINSKYELDSSFQEIFVEDRSLIKEGSSWIIESIVAEYMNIFIYSPLSGSSYIKLPGRLKNSTKGLIIIQNNNNKSFLWRHIRHLNPLKIHPERIAKIDKEIVNNVDYKGIKFPASKKD